jgi:hypothetical protein
MRRLVLIALLFAVLAADPSLYAQSGGKSSSGAIQFSSCCAIGMFGPSVPLGSVPGVQPGISGGAPRAFPVGREFRHDGFRHDGVHRLHFRNFGNSYPIYYAPYGYGYYDDTSNVDANAAANNYEQPNNDEGPGLTVFERRRTYDLIGDARNQRPSDDRYGEHYTDSREQRGRAEEPEQKSSSVESKSVAPEDMVSTILIFRDGSHREIRNYALMGNSIYDLSVKPGQGKMKILLADLDVAATVAANDQRGIEFKLPKQ